VFDIGLPELLVLGVIALFVIGPERLPGAAAQAGRLLRELRVMASGARQQLSEHLELDADLAKLNLDSLDPRKIVSSALFDDPVAPGDAAVRPAASRPVRDGERPPYDTDAT